MKKLKIVGLLGAALLLAGFSSFAVCPPGSLRMTPAGIEGLPIGAAIGAGHAQALTAAGELILNPNVTYCVEQDFQLNASAGWTGAGNATDTIVLQANTRVVGAHPGVRVTGAAAAVGAWDGIFRLDQTGAELQGFSIYKGAAGVVTETHAVLITPGASDSVVRDMTIVDAAGNSSYVTAFIEIQGGLNVTIQGCTLRNVYTVAGAFQRPMILVSGGNDHRIVDNIIFVTASPLFQPIVVNAGNGHQVLRNTINNTVALITPSGFGANALVNQILIGTTNTLVEANVINLSGGISGTGAAPAYSIQVVGIQVGNANVTVRENTIRNTGAITLNGAGTDGGALCGIWVTAAGANAVVEGNRVTGCGASDTAGNLAGPASGDAIFVQGAVVRVENNPALQTGTAIAPVATDIATGIRVAAGASNVQILNNTNINSATSGIAVFAANTTVRGNVITDSCTGAVVGGLGVVVGGIVIGAPGSAGSPVENNTVMNVSQGNPAIVGSGSGIVLAAGSLNQYILNNTVSNTYRHGIEVAAAGSVSNTIRGNTVTNAGQNGIHIQVAALNNTIENNTVRNCRNSGVFITGGALNTRVLNNTLENNGSAGSPPVSPTVSEALVIAGGSNNSEVRGNTITTTVTLPENRGIRVEACRSVTVDGNTIRNTTSSTNLTHGIVIETGVTTSTFSNNTIENMQEYGIVIRGGNATLGRVDVTRNALLNNAIGILFDGGASNVTCNLIWGGSDGIRVAAGIAVGNHLFQNNAIYSPIRARNLGISTFNAQQNYWGVSTGAPAMTVFGPVDTSNHLTAHPTCAPEAPGDTTPPPSGNTFTYAAAGWTLVSVPTTGDNASIFGVTLWNWNGTQYVQATALNPNMGYWANLPANKTVTATGTVPTTDQTLALTRTGWHMVSAPWSYPKSAIQVIRGTDVRSWADAVAAGWVSDTIWGWNGTQYVSATTIQPWYGYWLRARVDNLSIRFLYASRLTTLCVSCGLEPASALDLTELPPPPPMGVTGGASLTFGNSPNPITDVHTTTFRVTGPMASLVTEIKVLVFDLSGKLVWQGSASGAELTWHTDDLAGRYLANGVYLYQITAKVAGTTVTSPLLKLAIYR